MEGGLEADLVGTRPGGGEVLVEPGEVRGEGFHHEGAARDQVAGHPGEASDLVVLGLQLEQGVEGDEGQGVAAVDEGADVGEVADHHGDAVAAGLGPQALDHGRGGVDAVDLEPPLGEGQSEAAGADAQLEDGPGRPQGGEELDRRRHLGEAVGVPVVVGLRLAVVVEHRASPAEA